MFVGVCIFIIGITKYIALLTIGNTTICFVPEMLSRQNSMIKNELYRMLRKIKEARITHSWGLSDVNVKIHWYFYYDYKVKLLRRINESRSTYSWE